MPWLETDVRNERIRFVVAALQGEESTGSGLLPFRHQSQDGLQVVGAVPVRGGLERAAGAIAATARESSAQLPDATEKKVLELRERYGWGSRKLQHLLLGEGVKLSRSTIDRILDRHGIARISPHARPAPKRFERSQPNELVQMDFKGQYRLAPQGWCYPLSLLDDHSRFALALEGLESLHGSGVRSHLARDLRA